MLPIKSLGAWLSETGQTAQALETQSGIDAKIITAILECRYTPSPQQRRRLAAALGIASEQVSWGHVNQVSHLYGHGPQFGRSP